MKSWILKILFAYQGRTQWIDVVIIPVNTYSTSGNYYHHHHFFITIGSWATSDSIL